MDIGNEMTNTELFKLIDKDKETYDIFYKGYIGVLLENGIKPSKEECLLFLKTFFNQIKNGESN